MASVMTARGPVPADALGMTLTHEHIFINSMIEERATGLLNDYELMRQEVSAFTAVGGRTLVELTTAELTAGAAPDPVGRFSGHRATGYAEDGTRAANQALSLRRLSEDLDLHIVLGAGHYRDPFLDPAWFSRTSVDGIAERIVLDATVGFADTDVKAGIIGEIGADKWHVSALEERSFRAAARAHRQTGLTITTHASRWPVGVDQLEILASEGVDPRRVIIGHSDTIDIPEYHEAVAAQGAFVQFDTIRGNSEFDTERRVRLALNLIRKGYASQILLSHDVCSRTHLHVGGGRGYDFVPTVFAARLVDAGLDRELVDRILTDNPRRALTGED
jgi:phosphotriesterase-related protein